MAGFANLGLWLRSFGRVTDATHGGRLIVVNFAVRFVSGGDSKAVSARAVGKIVWNFRTLKRTFRRFKSAVYLL
jgi:hypothetical protein